MKISKIKTVDSYFNKGGKMCGCIPELRGLGECKKHTRIHTIRHMGFLRWLWVHILIKLRIRFK